ncbi:MAG: hypothetical protein ACKE51_08705 [Methylococcaceae bacterium]
MNNPNSTCTAAALTWSYMLLAESATPKASLFEETDPTIIRNMDNIKDSDADPEKQISIMGFEKIIIRSNAVISSTEVAEAFKNNSPHVGIFWNNFHTMGYSYNHLNKQFFDNNVGLFKAEKTKDIVAKMEQIRNDNGYGNWEGYLVIKLLPRVRLT